MPPPRARTFVFESLAGFDDEALHTFLTPGDGGVDPRRLGVALHGADHDELAARVLRALPEQAAAAVAAARAEPSPSEAVEEARRHVVGRLFWALLYWHDPDGYEELVAGEHIHPGLLDSLDLDGRVVADLGAGAGRFTLFAARHAARVIAVDAVPALLQRLEQHARQQGLANIETRRGNFTHLPLGDASVDVAVACSSLASQAPWGGEEALREAQRIVRPGGELIVIWPDNPQWFIARGFVYRTVPDADQLSLHFDSIEAAERICREFYSEDAAGWVREHRAESVPFAVLGMRPPSDACVWRQADDRPT
ncbi:MAG: methyltransferase domain-containing protein [Chloroflexi bacterium]|nr:MAG: methyltransferase domain-containing protein [Chloroflexota bacterium]